MGWALKSPPNSNMKGLDMKAKIWKAINKVVGKKADTNRVIVMKKGKDGVWYA